jgi:4-diphosphocytidyl-2-C-methyl-D-erythritol kinase
MQIFHEFCPAKINLFLKITGKRDDGYHELESLFAFLDLADELQVKKSEQFKLEISGEFAEFIDLKNNLFTEILDFFASEFFVTKNLHIKIIKNIPVAAGLGGGSSNAAFFIKALNQIFSLNLSKKNLQKIALKFGSDIPFFFEEQASLVKGRGEVIENLSQQFEPIPALLINPKIALSTAEVFSKFDGIFSEKKFSDNIIKENVFELIKNFSNDLEKPAISRLPVISEIINQLKNCGAEIAKMSGSGASCFGIFGDEKRLELALEFFNKNFPNFFVKKVSILFAN